jgi:hypothetical protein
MSKGDWFFVIFLSVLFASVGMPMAIFVWVGAIREIRKLRSEGKGND